MKPKKWFDAARERHPSQWLTSPAGGAVKHMDDKCVRTGGSMHCRHNPRRTVLSAGFFAITLQTLSDRPKRRPWRSHCNFHSHNANYFFPDAMA
jgi:hypothetical protein